MNITVVAWKDESSDYCRGCLMARYGTEHKILILKAGLDAAAEESFVAELAKIQATPLEISELGFELFWLYDGLTYDYLDEGQEKAANELQDRLLAAADIKRNQIVASRAAAAQTAKLRQEEEERQRTQAEDMAQLKYLKSRYEQTSQEAN